MARYTYTSMRARSVAGNVPPLSVIAPWLDRPVRPTITLDKMNKRKAQQRLIVFGKTVPSAVIAHGRILHIPPELPN